MKNMKILEIVCALHLIPSYVSGDFWQHRRTEPESADHHCLSPEKLRNVF